MYYSTTKGVETAKYIVVRDQMAPVGTQVRPKKKEKGPALKRLETLHSSFHALHRIQISRPFQFLLSSTTSHHPTNI
jgi:hypothetical protein